MLEFKRRVVVETEEPTEVNPVGVVDVRNEWLYDGLPIGLMFGGSRHVVLAKDVTVEVVIEQPECPSNDLVSYVVRSKDGRNIDSISLMQSWKQQSHGFNRYMSQSFPQEDRVLIPDDNSFLDCVTIQLPDVPNGPTVRIMIKDYLERKKDAEQSAVEPGTTDESGTDSDLSFSV